MDKENFVQSRISRRLYERLKTYLYNEGMRGRSIDQSDVLRDALVEFLDRVAPLPELPKSTEEKNRLNDKVSSTSGADPIVSEAERIRRKECGKKTSAK